MKNILLLLSATFLLIIGCQQQSGDSTGTNDSTSNSNGNAASQEATQQDSDKPKRYLVKSGIIEYEKTGVQKGTETVYFEDWGWREAKFMTTVTAVAGVTRKENRLSIVDGEWMYSIDLDTRTGTKVKNPLVEELVNRAKDKNLTEVGEEMMRRMGGEKIGTEEVAGKPCDVWEAKKLGTKSWIWNGVTLKIEANIAGMNMGSTATSFDDNTTIPADKFKIPSDVTITDGPDLKGLIKQGMGK